MLGRYKRSIDQWYGLPAKRLDDRILGHARSQGIEYYVVYYSV